MLHCDLRVRWSVAGDLRFRAAISEPKFPFFLRDFWRLAPSTRNPQRLWFCDFGWLSSQPSVLWPLHPLISLAVLAGVTVACNTSLTASMESLGGEPAAKLTCMLAFSNAFGCLFGWLWLCEGRNWMKNKLCARGPFPRKRPRAKTENAEIPSPPKRKNKKPENKEKKREKGNGPQNTKFGDCRGHWKRTRHSYPNRNDGRRVFFWGQKLRITKQRQMQI